MTWCHRRSITSSWNLSTNVSWPSSAFRALLGYQLNSWWETPSLPIDDLNYHRQHSCLPQHKLVHIILEIHPFWHADGLLLSPSATPSSFPCWNCMTYFLSCFRWILRVSEVWHFPDDHVNTIPKHVCGTPIINKNIGSAMLTVLDQLSKHRCMGKPHKFLAPCLNGLILGALSCSAFPWESYTLTLGYKHLSFPLVWLS